MAKLFALTENIVGSAKRKGSVDGRECVNLAQKLYNAADNVGLSALEVASRSVRGGKEDTARAGTEALERAVKQTDAQVAKLTEVTQRLEQGGGESMAKSVLQQAVMEAERTGMVQMNA